MNLNNRQRAGALVAALAVAALGVDRFVFGGGGPASASAQPAAEAPEGIVLTTAADHLTRGDSLASRLERFAEAQELDPAGMVPDLFGKEQWKVQAVFGSGTRGGVRVGGKTITVGGEYEGAVLQRVSRDGAFFTRGGREFFIEIERPEVRTSSPVSNG